MAALLDWGAERGARTLWLHVETDNEPAITLYESMGLDVHHACRYLSPGS
jgi:ribosomal protein S18 acetylase RimI-like enzyme